MVDHDVDVMVGIPSVGDWTHRLRWEVNQALIERGTESLPTTLLRQETCRGIINHCPLTRPAAIIGLGGLIPIDAISG